MRARRCPDKAAAMTVQPSNQSDEKAAHLHELTEALTALGNYLAAAHRRLADQPDRPSEVRNILARSLEQCERAGEALRRLGRLYRREAAPRDDEQEDFR
jgi:phosphoglycerate-specific signal transduction histidine kinase